MEPKKQNLTWNSLICWWVCETIFFKFSFCCPAELNKIRRALVITTPLRPITKLFVLMTLLPRWCYFWWFFFLLYNPNTKSIILTRHWTSWLQSTTITMSDILTSNWVCTGCCLLLLQIRISKNENEIYFFQYFPPVMTSALGFFIFTLLFTMLFTKIRSKQPNILLIAYQTHISNHLSLQSM